MVNKKQWTKRELEAIMDNKIRKDFNYIYRDLQNIRTMIADIELEIGRLRRMSKFKK